MPAGDHLTHTPRLHHKHKTPKTISQIGTKTFARPLFFIGRSKQASDRVDAPLLVHDLNAEVRELSDPGCISPAPTSGPSLRMAAHQPDP